MKIASQAIILLSLLGLLTAPFAHAKDDDEKIYGEWLYEATQMTDGVPQSQLSLTLRHSEGKLVGQYCYISNYGRRIDCPDDDEINVQGAVNQDNESATIHIDSTFQRGDARAVVRVVDNRLRFVIDQKSSMTLYSGPRDITLIRKH